ncbi:MAG: UPF0146 family protein [Desulfobacteria bacterium]
MRPPLVRNSCKGLVDYIAIHYRCVAEAGIGHFPDVALALAKKTHLAFATDIKPLEHCGLRVIHDDVTEPDWSLYAGLDLIYSLRPPPELVLYMKRLARSLSADLIVKPLASEHPGGQLTRHGTSTFFLWKFS